MSAGSAGAVAGASSSSSGGAGGRGLTGPGGSGDGGSSMSVDQRNWLMHLLYTRQEFGDCLLVIEEQLEATKGVCEYALYTKALIKRHQGDIQESLRLFQAATLLNPHNPENLKQVARSLHLLGRHKNALDVYEEASKFSEEDWEIWHNKGVCYTFLKDYEMAAESFRLANSINLHDATFLQLGKVFTLQDDLESAAQTYEDALEFSPHNPDILTTLGILYLRMDRNAEAFTHLGNAMTVDSKSARTILAAGSIMQENNEMDVALNKYRVAAQSNPNSAQLWNNIGMCFFGKQNYTVAVSCLKKALYLAPFEWIIAYNLGLVHLNTEQYASAFHYFSASINMKRDYASSYMYLAITLSRLDDFENACHSYEKAIEMAPNQHLFHLNYAVTLYRHGERRKAQEHFQRFEQLFDELSNEERMESPEVLDLRRSLAPAFRSSS